MVQKNNFACRSYCRGPNLRKRCLKCVKEKGHCVILVQSRDKILMMRNDIHARCFNMRQAIMTSVFCTINFVTCVKILTCIPSRARVQKGPYLSFKVHLVILCTRLKNFYQFLFTFIWLSQLNIDVAFRLEIS